MSITRPPDRTRAAARRRTAVGVATAALAAGLLAPLTGSSAAADPKAAPDAAPAQQETSVEATRVPAKGAGQWSVTLITGDTVRVRQDAAGRSLVTTTPLARPDGHVPTFVVETTPDGTTVIPDDALPAVRAGILEPKLFDVNHLIAGGFTDRQDRRFPVIVEYARSRAAVAATAERLPASTVTQSLESVHGAAVEVNKAKAKDFWTALRGTLRPGSGTSPRTLTGGVTRVWLDDNVRATLSESVPLVGAPEAWKAGLDGKGVTVAVLDTGVDVTHPDLAGRITSSRSFIEGEEVVDGHGHGTHVASTIAGTGAASDGARRGVAPGADLVVGKVLDNGGSGPFSSLIAGMEWATQETDAKIVSMSIGAGPSDGTDVLSKAVDDLTARTGALFVIAAGNEGPGRGTVSAPGAANSALTVAASSKQDEIADFSSRGPRFLDEALKPDIAAPGVDISAARAAGTTMGTPVDAHYTTASGTSMATPHVAGAAAIVAQQHPDWSWSRIKTALMSTSKDIAPSTTVYDKGAGRLDVARATTQRTTATTGNVDFGNLPVNDSAPKERKVTFANDGDTDVTLDLTATLSRNGTPVEGNLTLSAPGVTVPAGSTADVTVTLAPDGMATGTYSGSVVGTDADGDRVTVPVGFQLDPKTASLLVNVINRDGKPADPTQAALFAYIVDLPDAWGVESRDITLVKKGTYRMRVRPGTYHLDALTVGTSPDSGPSFTARTIAPEVVVPEGGAEVTLDARKAVPVQYRTPRPINEEFVLGTTSTMRVRTDDVMVGVTTVGLVSRTFVSPTEQVTKGDLRFSTSATLLPEPLFADVVSPSRVRLNPMRFGYSDRGVPLHDTFDAAIPEGTQRRAVAHVGLGTDDDIAKADLRGRFALLDKDPGDCYIPNPLIQKLRDAGAVGVFVTLTRWDEGCWLPALAFDGPTLPLPVLQLVREEGDRLRDLVRKGRTTVQVTSRPDVDHTYQVAEFEYGRIPADLTYRYDRRNLKEVRSTYRTGAPATVEAWHTFTAADRQAFSVGVSLAGRAERTEYFGGFAAAVLRMGSVESDRGSWSVADVITRPGRATRTWGTPVPTPGTQRTAQVPGVNWPVPCTYCRQGDVLIASYNLVSGAADTAISGTHADPKVRLFRDGAEVARTPIGRVPAFTLPKEEGTYRLEQSDGLNTNVWTFRSGRKDSSNLPPHHVCRPQASDEPCVAQPLLFAGYEFGDSIGLDSTVRAGRRHVFTVTVGHGPSTEVMPAVAGVRVSYSTDGGSTWRSARVGRVDRGRYTVSARYPELDGASGSVSLRVEARDRAGNTVTQTSKDALTLR